MRQRLLGLLAWLFLLVIVGTGRLLWTVVRTVFWLRFRSLLTLGGVVVVAHNYDAPTVRHLIDGIGPARHMILFAGAVVLAVVIVLTGVRSRIRRRLWRRFRYTKSHGGRQRSSDPRWSAQEGERSEVR